MTYHSLAQRIGQGGVRLTIHAYVGSNPCASSVDFKLHDYLIAAFALQ
jgi:hypothetical protein